MMYKVQVIWSPAIWNSYRLINYWTTDIKEQRTRKNVSEQLTITRSKLPAEYQEIKQNTTSSPMKALQKEKGPLI